MPHWTVRIDRRNLRHAQAAPLIAELAQGIQGMQVELIDATTYERFPDAGGFRDFAPVARITHAHVEALEYLAEEILEALGWQVDFLREP